MLIATLKVPAGRAGRMNAGPIVERPLWPFIVASVILDVISTVGVFSLTTMTGAVDWSSLLSYLLTFVAAPTLAVTVGYLVGWSFKRRVVDYGKPDWELSSRELSIEEAEQLAKTLPAQYIRLVPNSRFWYFMTPPLLLIVVAALPVYVLDTAPLLTTLLPLFSSILVAVATAIAAYGAFRATSNAAAEDFKMPLFREAIWLARRQAKLPGVESVSIAVQEATFGPYRSYAGIRVVLRVRGVPDGRIEAWSDEIGALSRLTVRLSRGEPKDDIVWMWTRTDREFWKTVGFASMGEYVTPPVGVRGRELSVKDIDLVTTNGIALLLLEALQTEDRPEIRDTLRELGVAYPENE